MQRVRDIHDNDTRVPATPLDPGTEEYLEAVRKGQPVEPPRWSFGAWVYLPRDRVNQQVVSLTWSTDRGAWYYGTPTAMGQAGLFRVANTNAPYVPYQPATQWTPTYNVEAAQHYRRSYAEIADLADMTPAEVTRDIIRDPSFNRWTATPAEWVRHARCVDLRDPHVD